MDFRCSDSSDRDMCFNGGSCLSVPPNNGTGGAQWFCICPGDYTHDFEWFHFANCARHKDSSLIFLIQFTIIGLIITVLLTKEVLWGLKRDARKIGALTIIFLLAAFFFSLSIYLQDGCYEGCAVFGNLSFITANLFSVVLITAVVRPVFALQQADFFKFKKIMLIWTGVLSLGSLGAMVAMAALCREQNPARYNVVAMIGAMLLWVSGLTQTLITVLSSIKLKSKLKMTSKVEVVSPSKNKSQTMIRRLNHLLLSMMFVLFPFLLIIFAVPIAIGYLSSFPYFYVLMYLTVNVAAVLSLGIHVFLKKDGAESSNLPKKSSSKEQLSTGYRLSKG